ncbi:MAG TPA: hypothetical protein VGN22_03730 [Pseudonocardia sp.]|jgi:hypothetical protein
MLINLTHSLAEADHRRRTLLAEAERFRLAKLAKAARRQAVAARTPPVDPPPEPEAVADDRARPNRAHRNDGANRQYSMSR